MSFNGSFLDFSDVAAVRLDANMCSEVRPAGFGRYITFYISAARPYRKQQRYRRLTIY